MFFSRLPDLQVVPFFQEGMMRVERSTKSDVQSVPCFFLNNGYNHPSSAVKVIKASTGGIRYTSDVVWTAPRGPVVPLPAPAVAGGAVNAAAPAMPIFSISYVPPPPPIQSPAPPPPFPSPAPPFQPPPPPPNHSPASSL